MNSTKIQRALTTLQEAFNEMEDKTILKLELTSQEVATLKAICWCNTSVPNAVVKSCPLTGEDTIMKVDVYDLLMKIKGAL